MTESAFLAFTEGREDRWELVGGGPRMSPSTRDFDMFGTLDEYKTLAALWHIVLIDPDTPQATVWSRDGAGGWTHDLAVGLDAVIDLPEPELTLPMVELYARVEFSERPRPVT